MKPQRRWPLLFQAYHAFDCLKDYDYVGRLPLPGRSLLDSNMTKRRYLGPTPDHVACKPHIAPRENEEFRDMRTPVRVDEPDASMRRKLADAGGINQRSKHSRPEYGLQGWQLIPCKSAPPGCRMVGSSTSKMQVPETYGAI